MATHQAWAAASWLRRPFSSSGAAEPAPPADLPNRYEDWRDRFIAQRLPVLYLVGMVVNPLFIGLDFLAHRDKLVTLVIIRAVMEAGLFVAYLALRLRLTGFNRHVLLAFFPLYPNICISHMILAMGDEPTTYYNGLGLVLLTTAVIVPVSWPSHLTGQIATLTYYYGALAATGFPVGSRSLLIESVYFLVFTCVALQISVILYERLQRAEFRARLSEHRARAELQASNQKLLELDRLKSEFFANISHELRTPLTLCLSAFDAMRKLAPTAECRDILDIGSRNGARLLYLINELLDLARFDSGRAKPVKQCFDLTSLVRTVAANFQSSDRKRVHFRGATEPVAIEADPRQVRKVLYNLVSNAIKFSDPEAGEVWIRLAHNGDQVSLEVEDNGIGIPREHQARIFDRFTQVESSATRRYEGTGIGLALVKEIVAHHGGTITVESEPGQGSTFTMTLPRGTVPAGSLPPVEEEDHLPPPVPVLDEEAGPAGHASGSLASDRPLVLVADDNPDMRRYLERVLKPHYRVDLAKDGADALDRARALHPNLILSDVMMPRASGHDLLRAVRQDAALAHIPIIFLTARAGGEARIEALEAGADDYIAKPFQADEVLARVANLIRTRAQERELAALQQDKLKRFLPPQVADMITSGDADTLLRSHRKEITVVFIDLRGFTAFAESTEPEAVIAVLREYQAAMGPLIVQNQGTLERFTGDAMMIFFNDPLPVENHPEQAVRLAVAMRDRVEELQAGWRRRGYELGAGIGMDVGHATLGVVGFEGRMDYAAIGTVTNLAARLCGEAQNGQILVSARFLDRISHLAVAEARGDLTLKGFRHPVSVHNIIGLQAP